MHQGIHSRFNRVERFLEQKRYEDCIKPLIEIIQSDEASSEEKAKAYILKSGAYYNFQDYEKALYSLDKAIELNPENRVKATAYFSKGNAYIDLQSYIKAINSFDIAIELDPEDARSYFCRAFAYLYNKQEDKAIEDYHIAIDKTYENERTNYSTQSLYKFCPIDKNTIALLVEQQIYFSDIALLNDPLECASIQEDKFSRERVLIEEYEPRIFSLVQLCKDTQQAMPFTQLPIENDMLFFSHYAEKHRGMCIEYCIDARFFHGKKIFYTPVCYQETGAPNSLKEAFAVKHPQWQYEHEARFVAFGSEKYHKATEDSGVKIKRIIFGYKTSENDKRLVYKVTQDREIELYSTQKKEGSSFQFECVPYATQKR